MTAVINQMLKESDEAKQPQRDTSIAIRTVPELGEIICYRSYYIRNQRTGRPTEPRTNWKLNGKVISQASLGALLDQI